MKSYKNLYTEICAFENLLKAAGKAQKGKTAKHNTARFNTEKEKELLKIQRELINGNYIPGAYTSFYIYEPKKRMISAAPYRDRVVSCAAAAGTIMTGTYALPTATGTTRLTGTTTTGFVLPENYYSA